ncbi:glycogen synthase GlgA [Hydrogenobaculum acidophilum]
MNICFIASECDPLVKVGGLGDVVKSLAKELITLGHHVSIILPFYKSIKVTNAEFISQKTLNLGGVYYNFNIYKTVVENIDIFLIHQKNFFDREYVYGTPKGPYEDNYLRFAFFSLASLETLSSVCVIPDIIHIHDWHTALVAVYKDLYFKYLTETATVFTIHNIAFQGIFPNHILPQIGIPWELFNPEDLEFYNQVNYLKGGIVHSDVITTVSKTHAKEIQTNMGFGLEGVLREKRYVFGILNGIDTELWNPATDKHLYQNYDQKSFKEGKEKNKIYIKELFGLETSHKRPLAVFIARLARQKGLDLIEKAIDDAVSIGYDFIFLGSGDYFYQGQVLDMVKRNMGHVAARIEYNDVLSRKLYAGADMFLMPSEYEPCGIGQMIAMRYGSIPIVHKTGGLADTVIDYHKDKEHGTGFSFEDYTYKDLLYALARAMIVYQTKNYEDNKEWYNLVLNAITQDFSWRKSVQEYVKIYKTAKLIRMH